MALKPAICTQCGGKIEVDDSKEAGICQFCGTAFVTEKVINKYITQNITQNTYTGTVYNIQNGPDSDSLYTLARRAKEVGNYNEAYKYYSELRERNPNDWEAVFYHAIYSKASSQVLEFAFSLLNQSNFSPEEVISHTEEMLDVMERWIIPDEKSVDSIIKILNTCALSDERKCENLDIFLETLVKRIAQKVENIGLCFRFLTDCKFYEENREFQFEKIFAEVKKINATKDYEELFLQFIKSGYCEENGMDWPHKIYDILSGKYNYTAPESWKEPLCELFYKILKSNNNIVSHESLAVYFYILSFRNTAIEIFNEICTYQFDTASNGKGTASERLADYFAWLSTSSLNYWIQDENKKRIQEFEGYIEKSTFCDKNELYSKMYKRWLKVYKNDLSESLYKEIVKKIKRLESDFKAGRRLDSPNIRKRQEIKDTVKKVLGVIFEIALPILVITIPWDGWDSIFEDHHFLSVLGCVVYYIILICILICVWVKCDAVGSFNKFMGNAFIVILEIAFPIIFFTIYGANTDYFSDDYYEDHLKLSLIICAVYYVALIIFWVISGIIKIRRNKGKK